LKIDANDDYAKRIKLKNYHWRVKCVECDAWHAVAVLCSARMRIIPSVKRKELEHSDVEIVCARCYQSVEYMLNEHQKKHILMLARIKQVDDS
jgi:hypothetical protein